MIRINKNYIVYHPLNGDGAEFIDDKDLIQYLSDEVRLDKTVTFERIFNLMIQHKHMLNLIYQGGTLRGFTIDTYEDEYMKFDDDKDPDSIDYLELYWHSEYWDLDSGKELTCSPSFHGIKENFTDKHFIEPVKMGKGLDFFPLNNWRKYKVRTKPYIIYQDHNKDGKTIEEKFPILVEGERDFKLFDLFEAILHEISFYGTPENRDEKADELKEISDRIDRGEEEFFEMFIDDDGKIDFKKIEEENNNDDATNTTERK